jgi:hypothetical protein
VPARRNALDVATRYDKLARNFLAATTLIGTLLDQIMSLDPNPEKFYLNIDGLNAVHD